MGSNVVISGYRAFRLGDLSVKEPLLDISQQKECRILEYHEKETGVLLIELQMTLGKN